MKGTLVVVDLETTGLDRTTDEIIEVGLVRLRDGQVEDTWTSLVRPVRPLSRRVSALTGLTDADLSGQPFWSEVRDTVQDFLGFDPLVGHNVAFDYAFLQRFADYKNDVLLDTYAMARMVLPTAVSYRLGCLCRLLGVEQDEEHRALGDAKATAAVFLALEERLRALPVPLLGVLRDILRRGLSPWAFLLEDCLTGPSCSLSRPREAVGQSVLEKNWKAEGCLSDGDGPPPDVSAVLGPGGDLARVFPGYEYRDGQVAMATAVQDALIEDGYLLVEAGTGTGKSLAYLVPAAVWALLHGQRVVVSTHTVNLQEQLLAKDIPLVRKVLQRPLRAAVLKGRRHYLCRRRWEYARRDPAPSPGKALFLARLHVWLTETATGDSGELGLRPNERGFWAEVAAEREGCAGSACRYQGSCFLRRARREAEDAQLIVTNHAMLLAELQVENGVLPEYGPLIIDEAHHLEGVATEQLGAAVGCEEWRLWLDGMKRALARASEAWPDAVSAKTLNGQAALCQAGERFFAAMESDGPWAGEEREALLGPGGEGWPDGFCQAYQDFHEAAEAFLAAVDEVLENIAGRGALTDDATEHLALQESRGRKLCNDLHFIFQGDDVDFVSWAVRGPGGDVSLRAAPVEAGRLLYEGLLAEKKPLVFTSATLTVGGSFEYFASQVGVDRLPSHAVTMKRVDSPFDYNRQVLATVINDLPGPGAGAGPSYLSCLCEALEGLITQAGGGTLVLFTAHKLLREAYMKLKPRLEARNIDLLGHGIDGSRSRILEAFQTAKRAALFGAASFWEGVDLPGEALRCLIIVKLPFAPPNHPVTATRAARLSARGGNPFAELSLPQAVIRFRQGFGRLIRTQRDRGAVILLDRRVIEKRYGGQFLRSLPIAHWRVLSLNDACAAVTRWLGN